MCNFSATQSISCLCFCDEFIKETHSNKPRNYYFLNHAAEGSLFAATIVIRNGVIIPSIKATVYIPPSATVKFIRWSYRRARILLCFTCYERDHSHTAAPKLNNINNFQRANCWHRRVFELISNVWVLLADTEWMHEACGNDHAVIRGDNEGFYQRRTENQVQKWISKNKKPFNWCVDYSLIDPY